MGDAARSAVKNSPDFTYWGVVALDAITVYFPG